ncbi:MAG: HEPN domain-containing protein [bacterium]
MKKQPEIIEWFKKAENDFKAACDLSDRPEDPLPDIVCYHCQQACEKYLKAFLVSKGKDPPRVHDLDSLLDLLTEEEMSLNQLRKIIEPLTPYAVEYRYPGEWATDEEAQDALLRTTQIREFIGQRLNLITG